MYKAQTVVERVQFLIKEQGLTQKDVLKNCDISENALNQMTDKKGISSFSLAKIADYLNCSVDYLLGRSKDKFNLKSPSSELTENEQEIVRIFKDLTETQQGKIIARAQIMAEQNEAEFLRKEG